MEYLVVSKSIFSTYSFFRQHTISERVAIAKAVAAKLGGRQGERTDLATSGNISLSEKGAETRDIAAAKSGLGSGKTYEAAKKVVADGAPELVRAMDEGSRYFIQPISDIGIPRTGTVVEYGTFQKG
jgi:hypothetical protein